MFGVQPGMDVYNQGIAGDPYQQFQYGSTEDGAKAEISNPLVLEGVKAPVMHGPGARRKLNGLSILLSFVVPCTVFVVTFYLMSFNIHYSYPNVTYLLCVALLFIPLGFGALTFNAARKKQEGLSVEPTWFFFLFATCFCAWGAGLLLGEYNYTARMLAYFDRKNLRRAGGIVPGQHQGEQLMDVSEMFFKSGAHVAKRLSYAYKNTDTYCVAPIVAGDDAKLASYDFWAVGVNCCFTQGDFSCGNMFDPKVRAGLRWWGDAEQQKFSMAVAQAKEAYGIQADHPLFFTWTENPTAEVNASLRAAWTFALWVFFLFTVIQGALVGAASFWYSRLHSKPSHAHASHHSV